jgi:predicted CXXCH cytochrome family protein
MWHLMLFLLFGAAQDQPVAKAAASSCVQCHLELDGEFQEPAKLSTQDIHFQRGLSCNNCHGGDPTVGIDKGSAEDSMSRAKGYIGRPDRKKIATLCASCHSSPDFMRRYNPQARVDQYAEYLTSIHGKKYQAGDTNVATCTDCHGAHGVRPVKNPNSPVYATNVAATCGRCHADVKKMVSYGIPTNQMDLYVGSVHGIALIKNRDLAAPTCNSCHGNHGAAPPGVDSVANVCGQCHVIQWDMFKKSPHQKAFAEANLPACVTCHEHHDIKKTSDDMLGTEQSTICVTCHDKDSKGYTAAAAMKAGILGLRKDLETAGGLLHKAETAGMEVSRPIYDLTEGKDRLVLARVNIHYFDPVALHKVLDEGEKIARASQQSGSKALDELAFRRKGLAVSVIILLVMIALLLLKIRQISRKVG